MIGVENKADRRRAFFTRESLSLPSTFCQEPSFDLVQQCGKPTSPTSCPLLGSFTMSLIDFVMKHGEIPAAYVSSRTGEAPPSTRSCRGLTQAK